MSIGGVATAPHRHRVPTDASPSGLRHLGWGAGLTLVAIAASFVGLAGVVNLGMPVAALVVSVYLLARGRHIAYVHVALALWAFAPGVRRIVDWLSTYHDSSPVLLAAPVASCVGVLFCRPRGARLPLPYLALLTLLGLVLGYALVTGVLVSGPAPALTSFAQWAPPFLLGLYVAFFPGSTEELADQLARTSWVYLLVLGGYGVVQWVVAPAWDTAWMKAIYSPGFSFGTAEPFGIRVFSLLNAPYPLGCALVVLIVTQFALPLTPPRVVALLLGVGSLALGGVQSTWIVLALVVVLLAVRGRLNPRIAGLAAVGIIAAVVFAPASFTDVVEDRLDTLGSGSSDVSYSARTDFYDTVLPQLLGEVTGRGFGSIGAGVRTAGAAGDDTFQNVDAAYIDILRTFGPVFGAVVLAAAVCVIALLWWELGGSRGEASAWSSLLLAVPVLAFLGDVFGGSNGALLWLGLALNARDAAELTRRMPLASAIRGRVCQGNGVTGPDAPGVSRGKDLS